MDIYRIVRMVQKDQIIFPTGRGILADSWVLHDIESCNFQNLLDLWFREASQNLSSFRQFFFIVSEQGGTKGKKLKNQCIVLGIFQHFSFGPPCLALHCSVYSVDGQWWCSLIAWWDGWWIQCKNYSYILDNICQNHPDFNVRVYTKLPSLSSHIM